MEERGMKSLPEEFKKKMKDLLKEEWPAFLESYDKERSFGLRMNPQKARSREAFHFSGLEKIPWTKEGWFYPAGLRPGRHTLHEAGLYYIQEPSAMAVAEALDVKPGEFVLDLCAAPGGKSTHIAGKLMGEGLLICNEIHPARAKILSQNVERMGIGNAVVFNEEPERLGRVFPEFFDAVAVDAPCSGEGMFRKDEEARKEWSPDHVTMCAARQARILECAAEMVRPGGRLVYSTCTFSPEENEQTIAGFLLAHPEFSLAETPVGRFFSPGRPEWAGLTGERAERLSPSELSKTVRIWPHKTDGEGHFLALLVKAGEGCGRGEKDGGDKSDSRENKDCRENEDSRENKDCRENKDSRENKDCRKNKDSRENEDSRGRKDGRNQRNIPPELEDFEAFARQTCRCPQALLAGGRPFLFGEQLYRLPAGVASLAGLRTLRPGLHLGTMKKGRFEPSHALAMALSESEVLRHMEIGTGDLARSYLRGEVITKAALEAAGLPVRQDGEKGWVLVTAGGCSLGWVKLAGGVYKNHYPKGLRIV